MALVLSTTVLTRGWENPVLVFQLPGKDTFLFKMLLYMVTMVTTKDTHFLSVSSLQDDDLAFFFDNIGYEVLRSL